MHQKFIVGNWKMYTRSADARRLASTIVDGVGNNNNISVAGASLNAEEFLSIIHEASTLR